MEHPDRSNTIAALPVEVLERITELLPASTRRKDCLSLLRVSKLWYGPAIRELFSFVVLDSQEHATGVLDTLRQNAAQNGALHTVVRKLCLLVAPVEEPEEEEPAPHEQQQQEQHGQGQGQQPPLQLQPQQQQTHPPPGQVSIFLNGHNIVLGPGDPPPPTELMAQMQQQHHPLWGAAAAIAAHNAAVAAHNATAAAAAVNAADADANVAAQPPAQEEQPEPSPAAEVSDPNNPRLQWSTALELLRITTCLQSLTIHLSRSTTLCEDSMSALTQLPLLRKLDLTASINLRQLWLILEASPLLQDVEVSGMKGIPVGVKPLSRKRQESVFHLVNLSISSSEIGDKSLIALCNSTQNTLRSLHLSRVKGLTRLAYRTALGKVGPTLRRLSLHKITFAALPQADANLLNLLDNLPRLCPMLEELQVAADRVVSEDRFLKVVLPSLFLTQLELDYKLPVVTETCLLEMIQNLPAGRMEALSLGKNLTHLATQRVVRAASEIGIVVLGASA